MKIVEDLAVKMMKKVTKKTMRVMTKAQMMKERGQMMKLIESIAFVTVIQKICSAGLSVSVALNLSLTVMRVKIH